jgi:hypothetical protein
MSPGDVNGDGHTDLAAVTSDGTLHIWNGKGGNRFGPRTPISSGWTPYF